MWVLGWELEALAVNGRRLGSVGLERTSGIYFWDGALWRFGVGYLGFGLSVCRNNICILALLGGI
jgi:hypothetical protein